MRTSTPSFVIDGETKIRDVIKNASKDAGAEVKLVGYARVELGEVEERAQQRVGRDDRAADLSGQLILAGAATWSVTGPKASTSGSAAGSVAVGSVQGFQDRSTP